MVVPFCVTASETPPNVGVRGNAETVWGVAGPRFSPKTVNILPRAMGAFGKPERRQRRSVDRPAMIENGLLAPQYTDWKKKEDQGKTASPHG